MGWRPSDRGGVVLCALQRASRPVSAACLAALIDGDEDLREWWFDLPTPGQNYREIKLSAQNVEHRLWRLEEQWVVLAEDGKHPNYGWRQRHYRLAQKDESEAIRLRLQAKLNVPPVLERKALATAAELGLRVEFFIRGSDHGHYFAICWLESKRGQAEHEKWLTADLHQVDSLRPGYLHEKWTELLAAAGLLEH